MNITDNLFDLLFDNFTIILLLGLEHKSQIVPTSNIHGRYSQRSPELVTGGWLQVAGINAEYFKGKLTIFLNTKKKQKINPHRLEFGVSMRFNIDATRPGASWSEPNEYPGWEYGQ